MSFEDLKSILRCPNCKSKLEFFEGRIKCKKCSFLGKIRDGIFIFEESSGALCKYYDLYSAFYDLNYHNPTIAYARVREQEILKTCSGVGADLGCGTGAQTIFLASSGARVISIDISFRMLKRLRQKIWNLNFQEKVLPLQTNIENLPLQNDSLDFVISMFGALNHVNLERALKEVSRVLKKGGFFIFSIQTKYVYHLPELLQLLKKARKYFFSKEVIFPIIRDKKGRRVGVKTFLYSWKEIKRSLLQNGFEILRRESLFLFLKPKFKYFPFLKLRPLEKLKARLERVVGNIPPFNCFGVYLIFLARKK